MTRLAVEDRPREKLDRHGPGVLGDNELLAIVIGHGMAGRSALAVADRVLHDAGGVHGLTRMTRSQLAALPGLGTTLASRIQAAVELGRRTLETPPAERPQFLASAALAAFLLPRYGAFPTERFGVVMLDTKLRLMKVSVVSSGSLDASMAHPREVYREATTIGAAAIVVFHNHPSGDPAPSPDDLRLTTRLSQAGSVLGIPLLDHIILGDTRYCSLKSGDHW
jgi:DNA repair protein RadC